MSKITMAWMDSLSADLLSWLSTAKALPSMIAVRCLTFDTTGTISLTKPLNALLPIITLRCDTRWLLSLSNANEAAFVAVRDNTSGARDALLAQVRTLRSAYPAFKGLDVRLESGSDNTHDAGVKALLQDLYLTYKQGYVAGHYNLTLPAVLETDCTWVYHASFYTYYNSVCVLADADTSLSVMERALSEAAAWHGPDVVIPAFPAEGLLYGSDGSTASFPFQTAAGYLLGTCRCSAEQPYTAFAGYAHADYQTILLPHVYDFAAGSAVLRPRAMVDMDGHAVSPSSLSLFALLRRYPPTPVVYWQDNFSASQTLDHYNTDNSNFSTEDDPEGLSDAHFLTGSGEILYKARTFTDFYAKVSFIEPADHTSNFGKMGFRCGNLLVVYNDPYHRIEIYQGPYINSSFIIATYSVPLERTDHPFSAPHYFTLEMRKRGTVVTVYVAGKAVLNVSISATSGYVGVHSDYTVMISEFVIGDAYKYDAHECVNVSVQGQTFTVGRVTRSGASWTGSTFTLSGGNEEADSRNISLTGKIEVFSLGATALTCGSNVNLTVTPVDSCVEVVDICLGDSRGAGYGAFKTSLDLQELYNHFAYDCGYGGLALDGLGKEDSTVWRLV